MINKTIIIAEVGVNHNGDLNLAKQLIDSASKAGADLVKFQSFNSNRLVTPFAKKAKYQNRNSAKNESQYELLSRLEISEQMHIDLIDYCKNRNIGFISSPFDIESIDLLLRLGLDYFKIPSGEVTNLPYLRYIGKFNKKIILSTGMCTLGEIELAIFSLENAGTSRKKITVLHCTSEYPAPLKEVNLCAMQSIRSAFNTKVGYSDHTAGIEISIAAVAMGASVIEKHLTIDRSLPGPDHQASLEPREFENMVKAIRNIEIALGNGIKRPTQSELKNCLLVRKSIVASKLIKKGEMFTSKNITAKRPGIGITPMRWDEVLGKYAQREYQQDEFIEI